MSLSNQQTTRSWYRWFIIGAMFVMVFTCLGFCSSNKGIMVLVAVVLQGVLAVAQKEKDNERI